MKKTITFMMGVLALASLLVLMSSCRKDCTCTATYTKSVAADRDSDVYMFSEYPENYGVSKCKDLAKKIEKDWNSDYYKDITCK